VDSVSIWLVLVLAGGLLSSALTVTAAEAPEGFPALPSVPVPELISHYPDAMRNDAANLAVLYAPPIR
jgi:hypothetical protein